MTGLEIVLCIVAAMILGTVAMYLALTVIAYWNVGGDGANDDFDCHP